MSGLDGGEDARRAVRFMIAKFVIFAILPVMAAAAIVYVTLPR